MDEKFSTGRSEAYSGKGIRKPLRNGDKSPETLPRQSKKTLDPKKRKGEKKRKSGGERDPQPKRPKRPSSINTKKKKKAQQHAAKKGSRMWEKKGKEGLMKKGLRQAKKPTSRARFKRKQPRKQYTKGKPSEGGERQKEVKDCINTETFKGTPVKLAR